MNNREMVYRSLESIERELKNDINVSSISSEYGFSLYYFSRLFKGITGNNLKDYILERKVSEAFRELLNSDKKILAIALDYGFGSHESFSRAFKRVTGINPSEVKTNPCIQSRLMEPLTRERIENRVEDKLPEPELLTLDSIKLVGIPFYINLVGNNDLSEPWDNLMKSIKLIPERVTPEKYYQVQLWLPDQGPEYYYFFIGAEVKNSLTPPLQFTYKELPRQKYLKFYHRGRSNSVGKTYDFIFNSYLPDSEYSLPHNYSFEHCGKDFLGPFNENSITEIYIPVED